MNIRLATINDANKLAYGDKLSNLTYWDVAQYIESIKNPSNCVYVIENNLHKIIGAIVVQIIVPDAEILQFWIDKNHQRLGYGKNVFNVLLKNLRNENIHFILLEVRSNNKYAISFYKYFGFLEIGVRKNYYVIDSKSYDALIMSLKL